MLEWMGIMPHKDDEEFGKCLATYFPFQSFVVPSSFGRYFTHTQFGPCAIAHHMWYPEELSVHKETNHAVQISTKLVKRRLLKKYLCKCINCHSKFNRSKLVVLLESLSLVIVCYTSFYLFNWITWIPIIMKAYFVFALIMPIFWPLARTGFACKNTEWHHSKQPTDIWMFVKLKISMMMATATKKKRKIGDTVCVHH